MCCAKCGAPHARVVERSLKDDMFQSRDNEKYSGGSEFLSDKTTLRSEVEFSSSGYLSTCKCNSGTEKSVVMDPFMGSGQTGIVAVEEGRSYVGIELNSQYARLAEYRIAQEQKKRRQPEQRVEETNKVEVQKVLF